MRRAFARARAASLSPNHTPGSLIEIIEVATPPLSMASRDFCGVQSCRPGWFTPLAVLSEHYRGLHHFFRQNFSQVTNPPIDSLRERRVMTLKTRLGNLGNIIDEDASQCQLLQLDSPVLSNAEFRAMRAYKSGSRIGYAGAMAVELRELSDSDLIALAHFLSHFSAR